MNTRKVSECLSCGSGDLLPVLDLGVQPLANNFLNEDQLQLQDPKFPLEVQVCRNCWLLQLGYTVPPVDLFSEYVYFSSFSDAMLEHARVATDLFTRRLGLNENTFVAEIASNDGYLLKNFVNAGIPCLGIEPAENIAKVAQQNGIETVCKFFGKDTAKELAESHGRADLILGNNVFAHAPDINDFVAGLSWFLNPDGTIALEFPYGRMMVDNNEFDTIYHEHVFYFSLSPLIPLFERHELEIYDVEELPIHGGSLRLWAGHAGAHEKSDRLAAMLDAELSAGMLDTEYYEALRERSLKIRGDLQALLFELKNSGKSVAAYGASAKGNTLLNFCGIPGAALDFIADRSPFKQGKYSPGLRVPIRSAESLATEMPDYALLLAWNFADEIIAQQAEFLSRGGKFIVPVPDVRVIGSEDLN